MANYVFAYSGGKGVAADEAERNAQYAKWVSGSESSVRPSSRAAPRWGPRRRSVRALGQRWRLAWPDRLLDRGGRQPRFGGRAREGCPVLEIGGAVDVYEVIAM